MAPVATNDVYFTSGSISVTAGLTGNVYTVNSLNISENYSGSIGSGATPLTLTAATTLKCAGRGAFYKFSFNSTTARIDTTPATTVYLSAGTFTNTYHSGSGGELRAESAVLTNYYGTNSALKLYADAATAFTLLLTAGYVYTARNIATYLGKGGDRLVTVATAAITTSATLNRGSIFNHQSSGTVTLLDIGPGASYPLTGATKSHTITNTNLWQGGFLNMNPASIVVTYTNAIAYIGYNAGGTGGANPL